MSVPKNITLDEANEQLKLYGVRVGTEQHTDVDRPDGFMYYFLIGPAGKRQYTLDERLWALMRDYMASDNIRQRVSDLANENVRLRHELERQPAADNAGGDQ